MNIEHVRTIIQTLAKAAAAGVATPDDLFRIEGAGVPVANHLEGVLADDRAGVFVAAAAGELPAVILATATFHALGPMEGQYES